MRLLFIIGLSALLAGGISYAEDRGGSRRYYQFDSWEELESSILYELRKTNSIKERIRNLRKEYEKAVEKYHNAEDEKWKYYFNPKRVFQRKMDRAHENLVREEGKLKENEEKLKDYLASTPPGNRLRDLMKFRGNREAIELRNSLASVQAVVESLGYMLETDKSQSRTAVEYYENYLQMLGVLQAMHSSFIKRAEGEYYDHLKNIWGHWLKHQSDIKKNIMKISNSETRTILEKKLDETLKVTNKMPETVKKLFKMRTWAMTNLNRIREKKDAVSFLKEHAVLAMNTEQIVGVIDETFLTLDFDDPPLIEFEMDIDNIQLKETSKVKEKEDENEAKT